MGKGFVGSFIGAVCSHIVVQMKLIKHAVVLLVAGIITSSTAFADKFVVSSSTAWSDIDGKGQLLSQLDDGDTLEVKARLDIDDDKCNDLQNLDDIVLLVDGGELRFTDDASEKIELKLGEGAKIVLINGGEITARENTSDDEYEDASGKKRIFIDGSLTCTGSGNASSSINTFGSSTNFTDPNCSLASFYEANVGGGVDAAGALPVTWGSIGLIRIERNILELEWSTMTEMNNNYFEVQQSVDGVNWDVVERKTSDAEGGNSSVRLDYSTVFQISSPTEVNYFRIKQVDFDGKFDFSKILVYKPQSSSLGKDPIVATLGGGVIKVTGNYYTQLAVYAGNGQLVWSNEIGHTTEIKLENSGAHWLVFRNRAGSVLRVKHMVNYE